MTRTISLTKCIKSITCLSCINNVIKLTGKTSIYQTKSTNSPIPVMCTRAYIRRSMMCGGYPTYRLLSRLSVILPALDTLLPKLQALA